MATKKPRGGTHAKKKSREKVQVRRTLTKEHKRRRQAALKGWRTRRAKALARSEAAIKGHRTRRSSISDAFRRSIKRGLREQDGWRRWIYEHYVNAAATYFIPNAEKRLRKDGEGYLSRLTRALFELVHERYPNAKRFGGTILYKRSVDGKVWDSGVVPKFIPWQRPQDGETFEDALLRFIGQVTLFLRDMDNPIGFGHAYKVKLVGLACRARLGDSSILAQESEDGPSKLTKDIVTLSRRERRARQLQNLTGGGV